MREAYRSGLYWNSRVHCWEFLKENADEVLKDEKY